MKHAQTMANNLHLETPSAPKTPALHPVHPLGHSSWNLMLQIHLTMAQSF